jgi:hypothetical protein
MCQQQDEDSKVELYRLSKIKRSTTNKNSKILLIEQGMFWTSFFLWMFFTRKRHVYVQAMEGY